MSFIVCGPCTIAVGQKLQIGFSEAFLLDGLTKFNLRAALLRMVRQQQPLPIHICLHHFILTSDTNIKLHTIELLCSTRDDTVSVVTLRHSIR